MKTGWNSKNIGYQPGSMYKRFRLTLGQKMNRQVVQNRVNELAIAGSIMFSATAAESEQRSVLAVKQMLKIQQEQMLAKADSMEQQRSTILDVKV